MEHNTLLHPSPVDLPTNFLQIRMKIHIHLVGLQNGRFPSGLSTKILYAISLPTVSEHVTSISYNTDSNVTPARKAVSVSQYFSEAELESHLHFRKHKDLPCSHVCACVYGTAWMSSQTKNNCSPDTTGWHITIFCHLYMPPAKCHMRL